MKKVTHLSKSKMSKKQTRRLSVAKVSYEKLIQEITPFVPRLQAKEVSTAGKWQSTSNRSLY